MSKIRGKSELHASTTRTPPRKMTDPVDEANRLMKEQKKGKNHKDLSLLLNNPGRLDCMTVLNHVCILKTRPKSLS